MWKHLRTYVRHATPLTVVGITLCVRHVGLLYCWPPHALQNELLLACAITHQSHVQGKVLEPCPRRNVQLNESMDPLRWAVDGTASTSDVFCRLFGTTLTTVTSGQSPAQHVCAKSTDITPITSLSPTERTIGWNTAPTVGLLTDTLALY